MIARVLIGLIRIYQRTAPLRPPACRFLPTCSHYAVEAIQKHGPGRGLLLTAGRLCRCHPFCRSGYDPVPEPDAGKTHRPAAAPQHDSTGLVRQ